MKKTLLWIKTNIDDLEIPGISKSEYHFEYAFQIACADWLRKEFALSCDSRFDKWVHVANESEDARRGLRVKLMGQSKGIPDFLHFGLRVAIELKLKNGKLSKSQKEWLDYLAGLGWRTHVIFTFEAFKELMHQIINDGY